MKVHERPFRLNCKVHKLFLGKKANNPYYYYYYFSS